MTTKARVIALLLSVSASGTWLRASTVTYDLTQQWANNSNPNSTWSFRQGNALLPYQSTFAPLGFLALGGISNGYAQSNVPGSFLPLIAQATSNPGSFGDYDPGDVVFHSVDPGNGNPTLGEFNIDWTAPISGSISVTGKIWYAQQSQNRSNDFTLELVRAGSIIQTFQSGTISPSSAIGSDKANADSLSSGGSLNVLAGDVVELVAVRTPGQVSGSADGVDINVVETSSVTPPPTTTPEPETYGFMLLACAFLGALKLKGSRYRTQ
jgi:hypothetical protein